MTKKFYLSAKAYASLLKARKKVDDIIDGLFFGLQQLLFENKASDTCLENALQKVLCHLQLLTLNDFTKTFDMQKDLDENSILTGFDCLQEALLIESLKQNIIQCQDGKVLPHWGDLEIVEAAELGHTEIVRQLINHGAEINVFTYREAEGRRTALMRAAAAGHVSVAEELIGSGADLDLQALEEEEDRVVSALSLACQHNQTEMVALLVQAGASVEIYKTETTKNIYFPNSSQFLEFQEKVSIDHAILLDAYTNTNSSGWDIQRILLFATPNYSLNTRNSTGSTILMLAAERGDLQTVNTLIQYGADIDLVCLSKDNSEWFQCTALMISAFHGHAKIASALITAGADVNCSRCDNTALVLASQRGHADCVSELLGCPRLDLTNENRYALHGAVRNFHLEVVKLLLNGGVNPNIGYVLGNTPLIYAFYSNNMSSNSCTISLCEMLTILCQANADPNMQCTDGTTVLMYAVARTYCPRVIKLLIHHGAAATLNHQDKWGETALGVLCSWARRGSCEENELAEAITCLVGAGADVKVVRTERSLFGGPTDILGMLFSSFHNYNYHLDVIDWTDVASVVRVLRQARAFMV